MQMQDLIDELNTNCKRRYIGGFVDWSEYDFIFVNGKFVVKERHGCMYPFAGACSICNEIIDNYKPNDDTTNCFRDCKTCIHTLSRLHNLEEKLAAMQEKLDLLTNKNE